MAKAHGLLGRSPALQSESHNVERRIVVPVQLQATAGAPIHSVGKSELLPVVTPAACLRCVRGVHGHVAPTSVFSFVLEVRGELAPRRVTDALRQTVIMHHLVHLQVFDGHNPILVDDAPGVLVGEVLAPVGDTLMLIIRVFGNRVHGG